MYIEKDKVRDVDKNRPFWEIYTFFFFFCRSRLYLLLLSFILFFLLENRNATYLENGQTRLAYRSALATAGRPYDKSCRQNEPEDTNTCNLPGKFEKVLKFSSLFLTNSLSLRRVHAYTRTVHPSVGLILLLTDDLSNFNRCDAGIPI